MNLEQPKPMKGFLDMYVQLSRSVGANFLIICSFLKFILGKRS